MLDSCFGKYNDPVYYETVESGIISLMHKFLKYFLLAWVLLNSLIFSFSQVLANPIAPSSYEVVFGKFFGYLIFAVPSAMIEALIFLFFLWFLKAPKKIFWLVFLINLFTMFLTLIVTPLFLQSFQKLIFNMALALIVESAVIYIFAKKYATFAQVIGIVILTNIISSFFPFFLLHF